jgi:signal transduction histidine kinase/CheY-like chemotaxis protein/PAS domain-containing protein
MLFRSDSTIRSQLTYLVIAAVLPIWLVSAYLVYSAFVAKRNEVHDSMKGTARSLSLVLDRELAGIQGALSAFATSPSFVSHDFAAVQRQAGRLLQAYPRADIIVADATGQQLVNSFLPYGTPLPKRKNPETVRRVFATAKPVISDLYYGAVTRRPLIGIDVPVISGGKVLYDLAMTFPADYLSDILSKQPLAPDRYATILDSRQVVVARFPQQVKHLGNPANPKLRQAIKLGKEGRIEGTNLAGTPVYVNFCRSEISNWSVIVGISRSAVMTQVYQWTATAVAVAALISFFGIALALTYARCIARAINTLVGPAQAIGRGEPITAAEPHTIKETGEVATALYQASALLQSRNRDLSESEQRYAALFANKLKAIAHCRVITDEQGRPVDYRILRVNEAFERTLGVKKVDVEGYRVKKVFPGVENFSFDYIGVLGKIALEGTEAKLETYLESTRQYLSIYAYSPKPGEFTTILTDITRQKLIESYKEMSRQVLEILSGTEDFRELMRRSVALLRERTGFAAVGIRLKARDDYPYFEQSGFSCRFLQSENLLTEAEASFCTGLDHGSRLACICGAVMSGSGAPEDPHFSPCGSFWTNDLAALQGACPGEELGAHARQMCLEEGYATLALIPIRGNDATFGLLQLNDRERGRLDADCIELLEGIASHIGAVLVRRQIEEDKAKLENQLQHAQKMESVGRLAGGVAHDFNNMLGVILGHANLALMDLEPGQPLYSSMAEIRKAAERSADLTRQLLAFARKQTIVPRVLNLNESVAGMLNMLQRAVGAEIQLNWQPRDGIWPVRVDPSQLDQILANLCINARDAIAGVGIIGIEVENSVIDEDYGSDYKSVTAGEYVRLTVSDNGCGMDSDTLNLIFEPFFTTKGTGKGSGLGLATVYGAVKQNNGFIYVHSEPGLGTTFSVFLPRYGGETVQAQPASAAGSAQRGSETILLVEDEPAILKVAAMILSRQGYHVLAADSPKAALRLAQENAGKIALLLTDVIMPEMNGRDLAQELLSHDPHLKRLFMSGFTADVIASQGAIDREVHFIQKPFSVNSLSAKVREVLDLEI